MKSVYACLLGLQFALMSGQALAAEKSIMSEGTPTAAPQATPAPRPPEPARNETDWEGRGLVGFHSSKEFTGGGIEMHPAKFNGFNAMNSNASLGAGPGGSTGGMGGSGIKTDGVGGVGGSGIHVEGYGTSISEGVGGQGGSGIKVDGIGGGIGSIGTGSFTGASSGPAAPALQVSEDGQKNIDRMFARYGAGYEKQFGATFDRQIGVPYEAQPQAATPPVEVVPSRFRAPSSRGAAAQLPAPSRRKPDFERAYSNPVGRTVAAAAEEPATGDPNAAAANVQPSSTPDPAAAQQQQIQEEIDLGKRRPLSTRALVNEPR